MTWNTGLYDISIWFLNCQSVAEQSVFHKTMINKLRFLETTFLRPGPLSQPRELEPQPEKEIEENGQLFVFLEFTNPIFEDSAGRWSMHECFVGKYKDGVERQWFKISSWGIQINHPSFADILQALSQSRLEFLKDLVPHVSPRVAFIDQIWGSGLNQKRLDEKGLKRLYWTTYFGPEYIDKHGREFLLETPAWKVEEFADGILITVTEKFLDFVEQEPTATIKHLRSKFPGIRPNRFQIDPNF